MTLFLSIALLTSIASRNDTIIGNHYYYRYESPGMIVTDYELHIRDSNRCLLTTSTKSKKSYIPKFTRFYIQDFSFSHGSWALKGDTLTISLTFFMYMWGPRLMSSTATYIVSSPGLTRIEHKGAKGFPPLFTKKVQSPEFKFFKEINK